MTLKRLNLLCRLSLVCVIHCCMLNADPKLGPSNTEIIAEIRGKQEALQSQGMKQPERHQVVPAQRFVLDMIVARVNGVNILKSDLELPRIGKEGGVYPLKEMITEELFVQRAIEQHMVPSELDIDRQIVSFKMQNELSNMSEEEFEQQLKPSGFSLRMYREQLGRMLAVESFKRAEVGDRLVATAQEVEEYYKKHPEHVEEAYKLKIATIEKADTPSEKYVWEDLDWEKMANLDKQISSILPMMKNGEESQPIKIGNTFQVIKVIDRRLPRKKTLNECYRDIEKQILHQKRDKYLKNLEKDVREKASIVYLA